MKNDKPPNTFENARKKVLPYNYYVLFLMIVTQLLNYADRQIIASVIPFLPPDFFTEGSENLQKGILGSAFIVLYAVFSLPAGMLADRWVRKNIVAIGLLFWSFFTALCAIAKGFWGLAIFRSCIGIGEATYAPAANSLLSDYFPENIRARIIGIFNVGMFAGGALGIGLAPVIAVRWGWEACFLIVGLPGIIVTVLAFLIREPKKQYVTQGYSFSAFVKQLIIPKGKQKQSMPRILTQDQVKVLWLVCIAGIFFTFSVGGMVHWLTTYNINVSPFMCLNPLKPTPDEIDLITYTVGVPGLISGTLGVIIAGFVSDLFHRKYRQGRAITIGIAFILSIPCLLAVLLTTDRTFYVIMVCLSCFFMASYTGPIIAIVFDVVPDKVKATALAVFNFLIHIFGDAISPPLMGEVFDATKNIKYAFILPLITNFLGAIVIFYTAYKMKTLDRKKDFFYEPATSE